MCKPCQWKVSAQDEGIQCDSCDHWFHAECEGITTRMFRDTEKVKGKPWFCKACGPQVKRNLEEPMMHKRNKQEIKREIQQIKEKFQDIENEQSERKDNKHREP